MARRLLGAFGRDRFRVELQRPYWRRDRSRNRWLAGLAERLEEAHDRLVRALESVETGPAGRSAATRENVPAGRSAATGGVASPGTGW